MYRLPPPERNGRTIFFHAVARIFRSRRLRAVALDILARLVVARATPLSTHHASEHAPRL